MNPSFTESDWRKLSRWRTELLNKLCARINAGARDILNDTRPEMTEHARYLKLGRYYYEQRKLVAACFDDWRRSQMDIIASGWRAQGLLTDEQIAQLEPGTQECFARWDADRKEWLASKK